MLDAARTIRDFTTGVSLEDQLPVCFLITVQNGGKSEQWVVAGDPLPVLRKAGLEEETGGMDRSVRG